MSEKSPDPAAHRPRRRRLQLALVSISLLLAFEGCLWWSYAALDRSYRIALEDHLRDHSEDSEAWFALATCLDVSFREPMDFAPDETMLERAIAIDPRPLYLLTAFEIRKRSRPAKGDCGLARLEAHAEGKALLWMAAADFRMNRGELREALEAVRKALACDNSGLQKGEGIALHRRFIRKFFGGGYRADSLILRHEPFDYQSADGYTAAALVGNEAARLRARGDLDGARAMLKSLHALGERTGNHLVQEKAARGLCDLALEQGSDDAEAWKGVSDSLEWTGPMRCGNAYADDDPWIVHNSWMGRIWHTETVCGTWLPYWYWTHRGRSHEIAERLGDPALRPWRRADQRKEEESRLPSPHTSDLLFNNRDILYRPVRDPLTYERLLFLAPKCDAAVLTLARSDWRPTSPPPAGMDPAVVYVRAKLRAFEGADAEVRRDFARALARAESPAWGPDAWRLAAQMDREAFLNQAIELLSPHGPGGPQRLAFLRDLTGQSFGFDSRQWQAWRSAPAPK